MKGLVEHIVTLSKQQNNSAKATEVKEYMHPSVLFRLSYDTANVKEQISKTFII